MVVEQEMFGIAVAAVAVVVVAVAAVVGWKISRTYSFEECLVLRLFPKKKVPLIAVDYWRFLFSIRCY